MIEIQAVGRDITPLKEAQNQIRSIIDVVPEGVLLDAQGYIRLMNPVAEAYLDFLWLERADGRLQQLGDQKLEDLMIPPPPGCGMRLRWTAVILKPLPAPSKMI